MTGLALLLLTAALGHGLAQRLRLPVIPVLLVLGMTLSFTGLLPQTASEVESADAFTFTAVELGLTFLVFATGIELNPRRFRQHRDAVLWIGLVQFFVIGLLGFIAGHLLGYATIPSIYLALSISASSTLVALHQLRRTRQVFEPIGRTVLGVLLVQDILMIAFIVGLARSDDGIVSIATGLLWTSGLAALAIGLQRFVVRPWIMKGRADEETVLIGGMAVMFVFVGGAHFLNLPLIAGAFLAGYSLSGFPANGVVRGMISSLYDFFQAIFFTALGALVQLPDPAILMQTALLALLVILLTPPLVTIIAEWTGFSSRTSIECGLLLAQASEFSLVLGLTGLYLGHIDGDLFSVIALMSVLTMSVTPLLATRQVTEWLLRWHPLRRRLATQGEHRDHVLVLGFGSAGMWVVKPLRAQGLDMMVVDDDPVVIERLQRLGIPCLRGDGSDEKILARAGASQARLIIASMRRPAEAAQVLQLVKGVPVIVRVFEEADAEQIRKLGGIAVLNSQAAADTFMDWFVRAGPKPRSLESAPGG